MLILLTLVALLAISWSLLLARSREVDGALQRTLILPFSGSIVIWLLWFGIREYSPPVSIREHWLSVAIALLAAGLSVVAAIRILRTQLMAKMALATISLSLALVCLFGVVLSIPVS